MELWFEEAGFTTTVRGIGFTGDDILAVKETWIAERAKVSLRLSVEAKNCKDITLSSFVDQAMAQAETYPAVDGVLPIVVAHRRGRDSVDDGYVVMSGATFIELVTR